MVTEFVVMRILTAGLCRSPISLASRAATRRTTGSWVLARPSERAVHGRYRARIVAGLGGRQELA